MKRIAIPGLAVTVVIAAVALINASLASTTGLCNDEPKEGLCKGKGTFTALNNSAVLETSVGNITCASALNASGSEPSTPEGKPLQGKVTVVLSACKDKNGKTCVVTLGEFTVAFNWTGGVSGSIEATKAPQVSITSCEGIECKYTLESALDINGGAEATIVANKETMGSATGSNCPGGGAAIFFSDTYKAKSFFVVATTPLPCATEETYGVPTTFSASLEPESVSKLKLKIIEESETTEYTVPCSSSTLEGEVTATGWPTEGKVTSIVFGECGGTCTAKVTNPGFTTSIEASGSGNGTMTWSPRLQVRCIGAYKCTYDALSSISTITGGAPAKMPVALVASKLVTGESDAKCGTQLTWEGAYRFSKPEIGGEAKMWVVRKGI
jgi:hypothetical protein